MDTFRFIIPWAWRLLNLFFTWNNSDYVRCHTQSKTRLYFKLMHFKLTRFKFSQNCIQQLIFLLACFLSRSNYEYSSQVGKDLSVAWFLPVASCPTGWLCCVHNVHHCCWISTSSLVITSISGDSRCNLMANPAWSRTKESAQHDRGHWGFLVFLNWERTPQSKALCQIMFMETRQVHGNSWGKEAPNKRSLHVVRFSVKPWNTQTQPSVFSVCFLSEFP